MKKLLKKYATTTTAVLSLASIQAQAVEIKEEDLVMSKPCYHN